MKRKRLWLGLSIASVVLSALFYGAALGGVRINNTESAPRGIWLMTQDQVPPVHGTYVAICLPDEWAAFAAAREYTHARGECPDKREALIKQIVAIPGDIVMIDDDGISVNGALVPTSKAQANDTGGRSLQGVEHGTYEVHPGQVWVIGPHQRLSFDSRYYGPLSEENIHRTARPWLTF